MTAFHQMKPTSHPYSQHIEFEMGTTWSNFFKSKCQNILHKLLL